MKLGGNWMERIMIMEQSEPIGLTMAKQFASWGWRVVPAFISKEGDKIPMLKDWVNKASVESEVLDGWWDSKPWGHPGIVSGLGSAIVIDADGKRAVDWLRELSRSTGGIGNTLCYRTPGRDGGLHIIGAWSSWLPSDFRQAKVIGGLGTEVQVRGNGHFTMSIGCKRPDGVYELVQEPNGVPGEIPRALLEAIFEHAVVGVGGSYGGSGMEEVSEAEAWGYAPLSEGRKNLLAGVLWWCAIRGGTLEEVLELGLRFSREVCEPELSEELVEKKARYTYERASRKRDERRTQQLDTLNIIKNRGRRFGELI